MFMKSIKMQFFQMQSCKKWITLSIWALYFIFIIVRLEKQSKKH